MPGADEVKSSWADEVEENVEDIPRTSEVVENGLKIVTEYKKNEENKKIKIVSTYKRESRMVSKSIAKRKTWKKFGASADDKPGPNPATTIATEEIFMQFITSREEDKTDDDALEKLRTMVDKTVKCRMCNGDHWTLQCPFRDTNYMPAKAVTPTVNVEKKLTTQVDDKSKNKYVPPGLRDGAGNKRGESMGHLRHRDDASAIRISNLSESTQEVDLEELVKPFGDYNKIFLAKDKTTGLCKGFAYIHFRSRQAAANAINTLNGHGYDHLILGADWSKPQAHHQ
ncbi:eukaryotic translation initiation factor 3 subunit G-like [Cimex lectularius]|uniref:Eukaryotic translation initiation factor 3 subunit G n=1 Tax=Cimex lectularius TaxID=79782 RepID=A0A8I6S853_CIMLE|nr:eukaryotic translation initiation factor 3 subunit G-like [Cimex lectularius]